MKWVFGLLIALVLLALWMWLIVLTEGVFFGRRLVVWLYDVTAFRYDKVKDYTLEDETVLVVEPVLMLTQVEHPKVLDVATGTGRVPYYLVNDKRFDGSVVGIDASAEMLTKAKAKVAELSAEKRARISFLRQNATPLKFDDACFDFVTCLESLEFFPSDREAIKEMVRVLKAGGFAILTRRKEWEAYTFLWRYRSKEQMERMLLDLGLEKVQILPWQSNYDLVIGRKPHA